MHIDDFETRLMEGCGHLKLSVDALLSKNGEFWTSAACDKGRRDRLFGIKGQPAHKPALAVAEPIGLFFADGLFGITEALDGFGRFGVKRSECAEFGLIKGFIAADDRDLMRGLRRADFERLEPARCENFAHFVELVVAHLKDRAELFIEKEGEGLAPRGDFDAESHAAGEGHLDSRGEEPAIGAIVIGEDGVFFSKLSEGVEEADEKFGIVEVRRELSEPR